MMPAVAQESLPDAAQAAALEHGLQANLLALVGAAGTGKTFALVRRAGRAVGEAAPGTVLVSAPSDAGVARLRARLAAAQVTGARCESLGEVAFALLAETRAQDGEKASLALIDEVRAARHFESVGAALFALEWTELISEQLDPEITGLRAPERFSAAAFRLIQKLRAALISPEAFKAAGLRGATAFYGRPPNLADIDLLQNTAVKYRDSLLAQASELERQRAREVDLVHILTRLYASYVSALVEHGCLTPVDAIYEATLLLRSRPELQQRARARFASAFVDDAQDLTPGQLGLLSAIFGDALAGVTLAGDEAQSTRGFATGARGSGALERARTRIVFQTQYRCGGAIESLARRVLEPPPAGRQESGAACAEGVDLYRAVTARDEARYVVAEIERLIADGTPCERLAIVTRNLGCAHLYVDALLARNVPVDIAGAGSLYEFPVVQDALAALWALADPFRHDYLLRNLEAPWLRLADASIAILCGEGSQGEAPLLFELPESEGDETRSGRWDLRRELRLGRNVTRGDVDGDLPAEARARLTGYRAARARWETASRTLSLGDLAHVVLAETVLGTLPGDARGRFERGLLERFLNEVDAFEARDPLASLDDFLAHAEGAAAAEADLLTLSLRDEHAVRVLDVEAAKGEEFEAVFLVDVRAGAWPRYYVPDAFLFMPSAGMIPKENVGDAKATRTAKFTYSLYRHQLKEKYCAEERRAFYCAATRARRALYVSAAGRATRGAGAPEILEELRSYAHLTQS